MQDQEQLKQRLVEIGKRFLRRTLGEMQRLHELAEAVAKADIAAVTEIAQTAHRIHGGGGMFGFHSISEAAQRLEVAAREWLDPDLRERSELSQRMESLLADLGRAVQDTARQQGML